jgi:hypothetical protein
MGDILLAAHKNRDLKRNGSNLSIEAKDDLEFEVFNAHFKEMLFRSIKKEKHEKRMFNKYKSPKSRTATQIEKDKKTTFIAS